MADLLFNTISAHVRLLLRVFFTLLLLLLGLVGDRCCAKRTKLRLYRHQHVGITQMTGWLSGFNAASAIWSFKASPTGWLGAIMLAASILWTTCDLAVSGLVVTVDVVSRCTFNTTGFYTTFANRQSNGAVSLDNAGPLFNLITQAQGISRANGGVDGIFRKVNADTNFRPDSKDIFGRWTCEATERDIVFPVNNSLENIFENLQGRGLIFDENSMYCWTHYREITGQLVIWSSNQKDYPIAPWDVRAAVEMTSFDQAEKVMRPFFCHMDAPSVEWALNLTLAEVALTNWCEELKGSMYADVPYHGDLRSLQIDPAPIIASNLNNIIMNAGAFSVWNPAAPPSPIVGDPTQGCLAPRALVPWPVLLLLGIVTAATFAMAVYYVALTVLVHAARARHSAEYIRVVEESTPSGLFSWMQQATRETGVSREVDGAWARGWSFGHVPGQGKPGLVRVLDEHNAQDYSLNTALVGARPVDSNH